MIKRFLNNNSKNAIASQQACQSKKPLVPVISVYPHREGSPVKVVYVQSTVNPPFRYATASNWAKRMSMELRFMLIDNLAYETLKAIFNPFDINDLK